MFGIPTDSLIEGALIFIRISGILFALPIFGDEPIPVRARLFMAVALAFGVASVIPAGWMGPLPTDLITLLFIVVKELIIGLVIGYMGKIIFAGLLMAASICGYQMGFGTAGLMMPGASEAMSGFESFHRIIVILIFLSLDLHHIFIHAMMETFRFIPAGGAVLNNDLGPYMIKATAGIFVVAVQLAAPILVALTFTMAVMGLIARTVPQMNVFTMSFPMSFFIGLLVYIATFPFFPEWVGNYVAGQRDEIFLVIRGLAR